MESFDLPGGSVHLMPFPFPGGFDRLKHETRWFQTTQTIYGRLVQTPRLTAWYGDEGCHYSYSTIKNDPLPWNPLLCEMRAMVETLLGFSFNSVLLNYYRSGQDSIGFHADNERELGPQPTIASLSFGAPRLFVFRHKQRQYPDVTVELEDQTLLLMMGETQDHWLHGIEKTRDAGERINLTFRRIIHVDK